MAISKFWLNVFGGMVGAGGGGCVLAVLQWLSIIKKGISPFNFKSNEFFSKFLQQILWYKVLWSKTTKNNNNNNNTLRQHCSLLRQRYCAASGKFLNAFDIYITFYEIKYNNELKARSNIKIQNKHKLFPVQRGCSPAQYLVLYAMLFSTVERASYSNLLTIVFQ